MRLQWGLFGSIPLLGTLPSTDEFAAPVALCVQHTVRFVDSLEVELDLELLLIDLLSGNTAFVLAPCQLLCEDFVILTQYDCWAVVFRHSWNVSF